MKLTPYEVFNWKITPFKPYSEPESRDFLSNVKWGEYNEVRFKIITNKYLLYVFDNTMQTALHWAAKWNYYEIILFLIERGANVNSLDIGWRTPLFIASKCGHLEAVKALLSGKADPSYKTYSN